MPYPPKPAPISYAVGPRFNRAIRELSSERRESLVAAINGHLATGSIQSLQMCGKCLRVTLLRADEAVIETYEFSGAPAGQQCLSALTDWLRQEGRPARLLMPTSTA